MEKDSGHLVLSCGTISLYRVIRVMRVMTSHLGVLCGSGGTIDNVCDCVCGVLVKVSCSDGAGGEGGYVHTTMCICIQKCSDCIV